MSVRSDIGIAIKHSAIEKLPEELRVELGEIADDVYHHHDGLLYVLKSTKLDYLSLSRSIRRHVENEADYLIKEACAEYPDMDSVWGTWENNPWNLRLQQRIELLFDTTC